METQELYARVYGRVQMVMYRDFAARKARGLGLKGYVKNLPDGTVEAVAQGEAQKLEQFLNKLKRGSMLSRVDKVESEYREPGEQYGDFAIKW